MRVLSRIVLAVVLLAGGSAYFWLNHPFDLTAGTADLSVEPGRSVRDIAQDAVQAGASVNPTLLFWWFRLSGQARQIKAGNYELDAQTTPRSLLRKLVRGEESLKSVTLVEGWTFKQFRDALARAEALRPDSAALAPQEIMQQLGRAGVAAEGRFFPDTYTYGKGASDWTVLQRAARAMDRKLAAAWALRAPGCAVRDATQALVLASIVEKETGKPSDRALISAVFNNRLRLGMRLQTDPTVIYGLGAAFDGNLRKADLLADTPWNTYTRNGLPPTPIAMPGKAALLAALQPAPSNALYFVARGDGTSQFSATLQEHNRAVNQYQRGKP